jgi:hypothetical protein
MWICLLRRTGQTQGSLDERGCRVLKERRQEPAARLSLLPRSRNLNMVLWQVTCGNDCHGEPGSVEVRVVFSGPRLVLRMVHMTCFIRDDGCLYHEIRG